ncbi:MAG: amidohydrolase [Actinobacteria bacterium]|nr:amidohydrolase [Actinomycetota bacterium]
MLITDAQAHLFHPASAQHPRPSDPWRPVPHVAGFTDADMLAAMDAAGVDRAVLVPPIWVDDAQRESFEMAAQNPDRFHLMARLDPYAADAPERIGTWLDQPNVLGIRLAFVRWQLGGSLLADVLEDDSIAWFWAACEQLGIPLMCLTQAGVAKLAPIARRHPKLRLVVDHMACVWGDTVEESYVAIDDLVALAELPNVYVKVSDAPNRSREPYPFRDVHPIIRKVHRAFGADRMMWAVDITQIGDVPYVDCLRLWQEGLPFLSDDERAAILGGTAATVLNWPEP